MKRFCVQFEFDLKNPLGGLPKASTVFGGLCWGIRESEGEPRLQEFLEEVENKQALILGDPHPKDLYLIPLCNLYPSDKEKMKKWKRSIYCKENTNRISPEEVNQWVSDKSLFKESDFFISGFITKNSIPRNGEQDTTPYFLEVFYLKSSDNGNPKLELTVDSDCFNSGDLTKYFSCFKIMGIGKKTRTGLGIIREIKVSEKPSPHQTNDKYEQTPSHRQMMMALGSFIPDPKKDPTKGFYGLTASPSRGLDGQIYPKITKVEARSSFFSEEKPPPYFGRCLRVAHNRLVYGLSPIEFVDIKSE